MIIGQIRDGIVLDHITAGRGMDIYNILHLGELDCTVAMIKNAESEKKGKKDIIKIGQVIDINFDVLGYIDPGITVNIIRDGKLVKREHLTLPEDRTYTIQVIDTWNMTIETVATGVSGSYIVKLPSRENIAMLALAE